MGWLSYLLNEKDMSMRCNTVGVILVSPSIDGISLFWGGCWGVRVRANELYNSKRFNPSFHDGLILVKCIVHQGKSLDA